LNFPLHVKERKILEQKAKKLTGVMNG